MSESVIVPMERALSVFGEISAAIERGRTELAKLRTIGAPVDATPGELSGALDRVNEVAASLQRNIDQVRGESSPKTPMVDLEEFLESVVAMLASSPDGLLGTGMLFRKLREACGFEAGEKGRFETCLRDLRDDGRLHLETRQGRSLDGKPYEFLAVSLPKEEKGPQWEEEDAHAELREKIRRHLKECRFPWQGSCFLRTELAPDMEKPRFEGLLDGWKRAGFISITRDTFVPDGKSEPVEVRRISLPPGS